MKKTIRILLIEDDADDIELLEESLKSNNIDYIMNAVKEGDKVASYLAAGNEIPDVIVLDFNLPRLHGRDILTIIKSSDQYKNVPLIVLSTSASAEDIEFAGELGADHCITKPSSIQEFNKTIAIIVEAANADIIRE